MSDIEKIQLFESKKVRTLWVEEEDKWYFVLEDVIGILTCVILNSLKGGYKLYPCLKPTDSGRHLSYLLAYLCCARAIKGEGLSVTTPLLVRGLARWSLSG